MKPRRKQKFDNARRGFTLVELMLVVAVLLLMASITVPMALQSIESGRLRGSADRVRSSFAEARTRAIRTGNQYAFYFGNQGRGFFVTKFDPLEEPTIPAWVTNEPESFSDTASKNNFLEAGVVFSFQDIATDSRSQAAGATQNSNFQRILFYPDGQVQPAKVYLRSASGDQMVVELRGITGSSRAYQVDETGKEVD